MKTLGTGFTKGVSWIDTRGAVPPAADSRSFSLPAGRPSTPRGWGSIRF